MKYAIELYFDQETEDNLMVICQKIADAGISTKFLEWKTRPHLTLACFDDVDESLCIQLLSDFARKQKPLPANISSVGMYPDTKVVFVSPEMTSRTYQFHRELHQAMTGFDVAGWEWYLPDDWVPHCTVALTGEDESSAFFRASELILREFQKIWGQFSSIGLVKVTFPVEEIFAVNLGE